MGLRYEFDTAEGNRIGIVARRDGRFEVVDYDRRDPDRSRLLLRLTEEEADAVAEILGAGQCGGRRNPATVTVTSRRTAARDDTLLAAVRACKQ